MRELAWDDSLARLLQVIAQTPADHSNQQMLLQAQQIQGAQGNHEWLAAQHAAGKASAHDEGWQASAH